MKKLSVPLSPDPSSLSRLVALQERFAQACNLVADISAQHAVYGRVPLHHLAYKRVRSEFGDLGSQLATAAIYAVSKALKQSPTKQSKPHFQADAPVYFDQRSLSLKGNHLSLMTLEGRVRFGIPLAKEVIELFTVDTLKEAALVRLEGGFAINFYFLEQHPNG